MEANLHDNSVAIIGMDCRFPAGDGIEQFWDSLLRGVDAVGQAAPQRWRSARAVSLDLSWESQLATDLGGFIADIDGFDAPFFAVSEAEARSMDPQQRMLLETTWSALEHAGIVPASLDGTDTGVFVGIGGHDFSVLLWPCSPDTHASTGASVAIAANRISYLFGLEGPSITVDTACSSSLVAVHLASRSIVSGECETAIVGGASAVLLPIITASLSAAGRISPDGRCRSFGESANGFVRSEGAGVVILKQLGAARRDGNRILALIGGSSVNHNGRSNGLSAPKPGAQVKLILRALAAAGMSACDVDYIEAAASGTPLGDAIEMKAIQDCLATQRSPGQKALVVGSVKSNIGHLEAASGVAGLIKTVLSLQSGLIPPSLHSETISSLCAIDPATILIPQAITPWAGMASERVAGINGFGFGGTNAHVIVRGSEPDMATLPSDAEGEHWLPISAQSPEALSALVERYLRLAEGPKICPRDLCASSARHRTHFKYRSGALIKFTDDLSQVMAATQRTCPVVEKVRNTAVVLRGDLAIEGGALLACLWGNLHFRAIVAEAEVELEEALEPLLCNLTRDSVQVGHCQPAWLAVALDYCWGKWLSSFVLGRKSFVCAGLGEIAAGLLLLDIPLRHVRSMLDGSAFSMPGVPPPSGKRLPLYWLEGGKPTPGLPWSEAQTPELPQNPGTLHVDAVPVPGHERWSTLGHVGRDLFLAGADLDWAVMHPTGSYAFVPLPRYAFQRKRYWPQYLDKHLNCDTEADGPPLRETT